MYRTIYVDTAAGPAPADVLESIAEAVEDVVSGDAAEAALNLAALTVVRLGREAGNHLLQHWMDADPTLLARADARIADTLANSPEVLTGPLFRTPSRAEDEP